MKKITAVLLTALMLLTLIPCTHAAGETVSVVGDTVTIDDISMRPDGAVWRLYENQGLKLPVPLEYEELLLIAPVEDPEDGTLFDVTEKASMEAALAAGEEGAGAGWLFSIARIDETARQNLLCYTDLSGVEIFAKDAEGMYYVFRHPTDVRYVREDVEAMRRDQETWTALNEWAWNTVRADFLVENPGLTAVTQGSTELDLYLARLAYMPGATYTLSTLDYGPLAPTDGFDAAPWLEKLMTGVSYEPFEGEAPDGEYVVLAFPDDGVRFDFFRGDENCIRMVWGEWERLFMARFEDESVLATEVVQDWYDALAAENGFGTAPAALLGGWTLTEDIALTDKAWSVFEEATEGLVGVDYEPLALLGTQLVSGTNYCFLCRGTVVYPGAQPYCALVYIYEDLQGAASITEIAPLDIAALSQGTGE